MQIEVKNPVIEEFIDAQVKSGAYSTPADVVEAFISAAMFGMDTELDEETIAAISEGIAQSERGELRDWKDVRAELSKKFLIE